MKEGRIVKVSGPLVVAEGLGDANMYDVVRVSDERLIGEIIEIRGDQAAIQVYEETAGLGPGDPVYTTGAPLSVELGPGLIESIFDGIQRPLDKIMAQAGSRIHRGVNLPALDHDRKWPFTPRVQAGAQVQPGDILGVVQETSLVEHRIMVPPGISGTVAAIEAGEATIDETVAVINTEKGPVNVTMLQKWPVRIGRPYQEKLSPRIPLITGQRVIDTFFPVAKGGTATIPGPFGSGKTVVQHQLAKWADADIVVYVGCGERGNEMTDVLMEFPELQDPRTGEPLMKRTVLVANTSDMPVAAREASIYTGITLGEYFRDMGYSVALMADSTSRWAEALREISGRMEEMPGEEGYPAYLGSRLAEFYERSGRVTCLGTDNRQGALTAVGAVSPPGGDISEPVSQGTLRIAKVFWSLDAQLASARHFPAINWLTSYTLYFDQLRDWFKEEISPRWQELRQEAMRILQEESELEEIVRLVGVDALSPGDQLTLETAKSLREDYLHQNAFDEVDTYSSLNKQFQMLEVILEYNRRGQEALEKGVELKKIITLPQRERIGRMKYTPEDKMEQFDLLLQEIKDQLASLMREEGVENA